MGKVKSFDEIKTTIFDMFQKSKRFAIIIVLCFLLIFIIIFSEMFSKSNKDQIKENNKSYTNYAETLEIKLENIISSINGAGDCKIMVTLETGEENVYAKQAKNQNEDKSEFTKTLDEYEYVILKSSSSTEEGMLLKVVEPNIRGVAIVCRGGDDPQVKEEIISAVSAVLNIKTNKISITKMK